MSPVELRVSVFGLALSLGAAAGCGGEKPGGPANSGGTAGAAGAMSTGGSAGSGGASNSVAGSSSGGGSSNGGSSGTAGSSSALQTEFEALWKEKGYNETAFKTCEGVDARGRILGEGFARGNGIDTPTVEQLPNGGARYVASGFGDDLLTIELEELVGIGEYAEASGTFYVSTAATGDPDNYQTFCFEGILKRRELRPGKTCNLLISRTFGSTAGGACVGDAADYLSAMLTEKPLAVP